MNEARQIVDKWVARIGLGFHPDTRGDTRGDDYVDARGERFFDERESADYDADMERLFEVADDPYAIGLEAFKAAGLI